MLKVLAHCSVLDDPRAATPATNSASSFSSPSRRRWPAPRPASRWPSSARAKEALLRQVLELPHGIPSHDTFSTVFRTLDPAAFGEIFARFAAAFGTAIGKDDVVAVDGNPTYRQTRNTSNVTNTDSLTWIQSARIPQQGVGGAAPCYVPRWPFDHALH